MKPPTLLPLLCTCLLLAGLLLALILLPSSEGTAAAMPAFRQFFAQSTVGNDAGTDAGSAALRALPWTALVVLLILTTLWYFIRRNRK